MQASALAALLLLPLAGCAGTADGYATPGFPSPYAAAGETFVSVVGTPFLLAFKVPVCAASIAIAGPIAGVSALTAGGGQETRRILGEGLVENCGPPYVLAP